MKKLIKLNIENTTNLREIEDSFCEVYSHDRNNGAFEFEITNDTLANETVTALFKFLRTGGYWKTTGTIEDNKIKVKFDTSLITQNEDVVCYLYLDDTERDSDIFSFKFRVKLSELDRSNQLVHKERYINNNVVIDRLNVVTHEDLEKVKSLIPVDVVNAEDLNREIKRIDALETKADNDTIYDDTDLKNRVKSLEDKPDVDIKNLATKKELEEISNRQSTVDTSNLVTKDVFDSELNALSRSIPDNLYQTFDEPTVPEYLKGVVELNLEPRPITISAGQLLTDRKKWYIAKGDLENEKYVNFHATLYSLANSLPDFYNLEDVEKDIVNNNVIFLTNKNFEEHTGVGIQNIATKEELRKAFLDDEEREKYAKKTELPQPYNDTDITNRLTALENRPVGSGGYVDTRNFVTKSEFKDFQKNSSLVFNEQMFDFFQRDEFKENPDKDGYIGQIFLGITPEIFKGERDGYLEFVEFQQLMRALVDVLPNQYYHIEESKITFLTDRNFKEMVATPEFKAVVKESLRDIVKEIMREEN